MVRRQRVILLRSQCIGSLLLTSTDDFLFMTAFRRYYPGC